MGFLLNDFRKCCPPKVDDAQFARKIQLQILTIVTPRVVSEEFYVILAIEG